MKLFLLALVSISLAKTTWDQLDNYNFDTYVKEFSKNYRESEYKEREAIFNERLEKIRSHNSKDLSWKLGVNKFTDWSDSERAAHRGLDRVRFYNEFAEQTPIKSKTLNVKTSKLPVHVDWRDSGVITPVKDQGQCGSCWTFGTTETIESTWAIKTGNLFDLSEQQILDCTANTNDCGGTGGCGGGTPALAMSQLISMGGQTSEWMYPYQSYFGNNFPSCRFDNSSMDVYAKLSSYVILPTNQQQPIIEALAQVGPLIINVDASTWDDYESGIYNGCNQTNPDIDHVVQLVGYGHDPKLGDYWLVRNSWSTEWGELGYIRLARPKNPPCGVDITPQDGTGCNNGPATVPVCGTCGILMQASYPVLQ